jgi:hypothetical protein
MVPSICVPKFVAKASKTAEIWIPKVGLFWGPTTAHGSRRDRFLSDYGVFLADFYIIRVFWHKVSAHQISAKSVTFYPIFSQAEVARPSKLDIFKPVGPFQKMAAVLCRGPRGLPTTKKLLDKSSLLKF